MTIKIKNKSARELVSDEKQKPRKSNWRQVADSSPIPDQIGSGRDHSGASERPRKV
jgi:hypothetical protein